jgi:hypothetical protein
MTGCKTMTEIELIHNQLISKIKQIKLSVCDSLIEYHDNNVQVEMINGTFYVNQPLDLNKVLNVFQKKYSYNEVFIIQNKKSPLNFSIKSLGYFDKIKCKEKIPSVFVYSTGAINIIAAKKKILYDTYEFMKKNILQNYEYIIQKKLILKPNCA